VIGEGPNSSRRGRYSAWAQVGFCGMACHCGRSHRAAALGPDRASGWGKETAAYGATRPLSGVPTKVRLLNRLPMLDLSGGDYSSCPVKGGPL
jgi:hypothetical protein